MLTIESIIKELKKGTVINNGSFKYLGKLDYLDEENALTFIEDSKFINRVKNRNIATVVCNKELIQLIKGLRDDIGIVEYERPRELFYMIHEYLIDNGYYFKNETNKISKDAVISKYAFIANKNVEIGAETIIEEGVIVKERVRIGKGVIIRSGTIIGGEGYENIIIDGKKKIVKHGGWTIIGDNVEILSNCCVCKGLFSYKNTVIEGEVTIDNLVHIAHAVRIGKSTSIASGAIIAGNVNIEENVWIGPGVIISNGLKIGKGAYISIGSVVIHNIKPGEKVSGNFAMRHEDFMRLQARQRLSLIKDKNSKIR